MGLIPGGFSPLAALNDDLLNPVIFRSRFIATFVADVTVEETGSDDLEITEHPVEQGAAITDHSYKRPAELTVRCGYSNSSVSSQGNPNYVDQIYSQFLDLQATRKTFEVMTGKRLYTSMLIRRLTQTTDEKTENALALVVELKQIIIVSTQTVTVPDSTVMKTPQVNAPVQDLGTQAAQPSAVIPAAMPGRVLERPL